MYSTLLLGSLLGLAAGLLVARLVKTRGPLKLAVVALFIAAGAAGARWWYQGGQAGKVEDVGGRFDEAVLKSPRPVLVDFFATWCGPCRRLAPTIEKLRDDYAGRVDVVKVDVDRWGELVRRYEIKGYPTVVLFVRGQPQQRLMGASPEAAYRDMLDNTLAAWRVGSQPAD